MNSMLKKKKKKNHVTKRTDLENHVNRERMAAKERALEYSQHLGRREITVQGKKQKEEKDTGKIGIDGFQEGNGDGLYGILPGWRA